MAENHAIVFWNLTLNQLGPAQQPDGMKILNINAEELPGFAAYFNAGWRVVSHTVTPFANSYGNALLVSLYLQRVEEIPDSPGSLT